MKSSVNITSKEYFRALQIIYAALIAGQVLFGLIAVLVLKNSGAFIAEVDILKIFSILVPVVVVAGIAGSHFVFRSRLLKLKALKEIKEIMPQYRAALVVRYAFLEGPSFLSILSYLMTGNSFFLIVAALIIVLFLMLKPSRERAVNELALNPDNEKLIFNHDAIVEVAFTENDGEK